MADKATTTKQQQVAAEDTTEITDGATATAIAVVEPEEELGPASELFPPLAMTTSELLEEITDAMGGEDISAGMLVNIQLPLGGGKYFNLPVLNEEEEDPQQETFDGIILASHMMRTYWSQSYGGESSPPDCSSPDGLLPIEGGAYGYGSEGNPSGTCATCPMAKFGSATVGKGQACKLKAVIYMLLPGHRFPVRLILPPTSLSQKDSTGWKTYRQRLTAMSGGHVSSVITRVGIRQVPFGTGGGRNASTYAVATFKAVGPKLTVTERARARALAESLRGQLVPASPVRNEDEQQLLEAGAATSVKSSGDF